MNKKYHMAFMRHLLSHHPKTLEALLGMYKEHVGEIPEKDPSKPVALPEELEDAIADLLIDPDKQNKRVAGHKSVNYLTTRPDFTPIDQVGVKEKKDRKIPKEYLNPNPKVVGSVAESMPLDISRQFPTTPQESPLDSSAEPEAQTFERTDTDYLE